MDATKSEVLAGAAPSSVEEEPAAVAQIVARAQSGDAAAFADLMRLYEGRVIRLGLQMGLRREDALDACQDAFVKVFRYIHRFRTGQSFFKWLYRIAIHAIYDHLRRNRSRGFVSLEELDGEQLASMRDPEQPADARIEHADLSRRLVGSLGLLSRKEKIVFVLRDMQGLPADEVGVVLGISQVTVRRHCMSARQKLRTAVFGKKTERSGPERGNYPYQGSGGYSAVRRCFLLDIVPFRGI